MKEAISITGLTDRRNTVHSVSTSPVHTATQATQATHSVWRTSILYTAITTLLFGLGYPLVVTLLAGILFPHKAAGSLILKDGQVIGSSLLAQSFTSDRYFHPRPSAAGSGYDATSSGGSNLAQSNAKLVQRIQGDIDKLTAANPGKPVPIDLVTTSGSGLDPDITPDAAFYQLPRVAKARGLSDERLRALIEKHVAGRQLGFLGEPRVNVLELNLDLDTLGVVGDSTAK
jgi:potassium-transporting ATPase KdpC subunit